MPQQNASVARYNRTVRYAWLARTLFDTIEQVQDKATRWLWSYNHERPNMALGGITPMQKLALAASLPFWRLLRMGGLPIVRHDRQANGSIDRKSTRLNSSH